MREVGERLLAGLEEYQPTGDRTVDLVLCACAGIARPDYAGEFSGVPVPDYEWAHAKLSGGSFPSIWPFGAAGYELTHQVFWGTDYGRAPIQDAAVLAQILAEVEGASDPDLLCELGIAAYAVGGQVPQKCIDAAANPADPHHECVAALLHRYL